MADRIVDLLTLAGVLALVALPVAVVVIGVLVWINRRRARAIKDWASRHGDLKRRLADVEALRKRDQWERGEMELDGVTSREQAERLARHRDPCRVPPAGWDCTRAPGHDGPCAAVPSMIREHLGDDAINWTPEAGRAAVDRERLK